LRDSGENLDEAATLAPDDAEIRRDRDRAAQRLQEALLERATQAEKRGDESAQQKNAWADRTAEREYRAALEDLSEIAQPSESSPQPRGDSVTAATAPPPVAQEAHARVSRKLADLLTRLGQREQKEGTQLSDWNPDEALDQFGTALQHFTEAQEIQPDHPEAGRGAREVRAAMEKLLVQEGQAQLQQGKEQLTRQSPAAARSLEAALGNFEEALAIRPTSVPALNGAEEARRLLPEALAMAGQSELRAGDRAEPNSPTDALSHYQQSESDFQESLELRPGQPQAQQGLEEVQPKLARLRERIAKDADAAAKQMAQNRPPPTLQSLLGQVEERELPRDAERQRQRGRKDTGSRPTTRDW
jgi:tetratricopeptide (TPR) repeat protein